MPEPAEQSMPHRLQQLSLELRHACEHLELLDSTGHVPDPLHRRRPAPNPLTHITCGAVDDSDINPAHDTTEA
ncbi:hypothetical protein [Streptomyces sp. NBC_01092]|uniref:hypothetical protein n=1 Tax=Streptomyces sp. NBC_01092 TaxID=2903748 RepID=UPI0038672F0C|nr:hypothetical protein OG254_38940 [Streptomyces sp. NBC_01092]